MAELSEEEAKALFESTKPKVYSRVLPLDEVIGCEESDVLHYYAIIIDFGSDFEANESSDYVRGEPWSMQFKLKCSSDYFSYRSYNDVEHGYINMDSLEPSTWKKNLKIGLLGPSVYTLSNSDGNATRNIALSSKTAVSDNPLIFYPSDITQSTKKIGLLFKIHAFLIDSTQSVTITMHDFVINYKVVKRSYTGDTYKMFHSPLSMYDESGNNVGNSIEFKIPTVLGISYNLDGGVIDGINSSDVNKYKKYYYYYLRKDTYNILQSTKPKKFGYIFDHWEASPANDKKNRTITSEVTNDIYAYSVYAKYKPEPEYTIKYIVGDDDTLINGSTTSFRPSKLPLKIYATAKKANYEFLGWNEKSKAVIGSYPYTIKEGTDYDITLYAIYKVSTYTYTVKYVNYDDEDIEIGSESISGDAGSVCNYTYKEYDGYELVDNGKNPITDTTLNIKLEKDNGLVKIYCIKSVPKISNYTVKYLKENTATSLYREKTGTGNTGDEITIEHPAIPGYSITSSSSKITSHTLVENDSDNIIKLYYSPDKYEYRILYYEDGTTNSVTNTVEGSAAYDSTKTVSSPSILGYNLKDSKDGSVSIKIGLTKEANTRTVYYVKKQYNYVVKYLEQGTNKSLKTDETFTALYRDVITKEHPSIPDYNPVLPAKSLTISDSSEDNVLHLYYTKEARYDYTIIHQDYKTRDTLSSESGSDVNNATISANYKVITGYKPHDFESYTFTINKSISNQFILYYDKNVYTITFKYLKSGTNTALHSDIVKSYEYNDEIEINPLEISGYKVINSIPNQRATEDKTFIFYYDTKDCSYEIKYVDSETNRDLCDAVKGTLKYGEESHIKHPKIDHYNVADNSTELVVSGKLQNNTYVVKYNPILYPYEIKYVDSEGKIIHESITGKDKYNSLIQVTIPPVKDYVARPNQTDPLHISDSKNVRVIIYDIAEYTYFVKFLDSVTLQEIAKQEKHSVRAYDVVTITPKSIEKYICSTPDSITKTIDSDNLIINLYYKKETCTYTVRCIDKDSGNDIITPKQAESSIDTLITEYAVNIPDYKLVSDAVLNVIITDNDTELIFKYCKIVEFTYTVKYVNVDTREELQPHDEFKVDPDTAITVDAKPIEDYEVVTKVPLYSKVTEDGMEFVIEYQTLMCDVTIKYLDRDTGNEIKEQDTHTGIKGKSIIIPIPEIEGYIPEKDEVIEYVFNKQQDVLIIYYGKPNSIDSSDDDTEQCSNEENVALAMHLLDEMKCIMKQLSMGNNIDTHRAMVLADIGIFYNLDDIVAFRDIIYGNN